jgi:hypothetical protein
MVLGVESVAWTWTLLLGWRLVLVWSRLLGEPAILLDELLREEE